MLYPGPLSAEDRPFYFARVPDWLAAAILFYLRAAHLVLFEGRRWKNQPSTARTNWPGAILFLPSAIHWPSCCVLVPYTGHPVVFLVRYTGHYVISVCLTPAILSYPYASHRPFFQLSVPCKGTHSPAVLYMSYTRGFGSVPAFIIIYGSGICKTGVSSLGSGF
jgi:hypothetical protein